MILDVGCGYLSDHKRREGIGIDLHRGTCDIVADTHHLPFQPSTFKKIYAYNILEHLNNPMVALKELNRVLKANGVMSITIPIHHNPCQDEIIKFLVGFPFRIPITLKRLLRWRKYRRERGFTHKNRIEPKHIAQLFSALRCFSIYPKHSLQRIKKGKLLKLLGVEWLPTLPDNYFVYAYKTNKQDHKVLYMQ
jgi:SAM-dependent methyltransferase